MYETQQQQNRVGCRSVTRGLRRTACRAAALLVLAAVSIAWAGSSRAAPVAWSARIEGLADVTLAGARLWVAAGQEVRAIDLASGKAVLTANAGADLQRIAGDDTTIAAAGDRVVVVLDAATGAPRFRIPVREGVAYVAVGHGVVVLARKNGVLEAYPTERVAHVVAAAPPTNPPAVPGGETPPPSTPPAAPPPPSADPNAPPKRLWRAYLSSPPSAEPLVTKNIVFAGDALFVHGFRRASGKRAWRFAVRDPATPLAVGRAAIVASKKPSFTTALTPERGTYLWTYRLARRALAPPVSAARRIFTAARQGTEQSRRARTLLRALSRGGQLRWALALPGIVKAMGAGDAVVAASVGPRVFWIDARRGLLLDEGVAPAPVSRLFVAAGSVVAVGEAGELSAFVVSQAAGAASVDAALKTLAPNGPAREDLEKLAVRFVAREAEAISGERIGAGSIVVVARRAASDLLLGRPVLALEVLVDDSYIVRIKLAADAAEVLAFDNDQAASRSEFVEVTPAQAELLTRDKVPLPKGATLSSSRVEVDSDGKAYLEVRWTAQGASKPEMEMRLHPRTGALISMAVLWKIPAEVNAKWNAALLASAPPDAAPATREAAVEIGRSLLAGRIQHHKLASRAYDVAFDGTSMWVTTNGGVYRVSPTTGEHTRLTTRDGLLDNEVTAISAAKGSAVWVASARGLTRIVGQEVRRHAFDLAELRGRDVEVRSIAQGKDIVWLATNAGVIRFREGEFTWFGAAHGLLSENARGVAVAANGDAWVATEEGVARFDGKRWQMVRQSDGLAQNDTVAVLVDSRGHVWVATQENGVSRFDGKKWKTFKQVTGYGLDEEDGPPSNRILDFALDTPGNLWALHEKGLSRFKGGKWFHFPLAGAARTRRLSRVVHAGRRMVCVARGAGQGLVAFNGRAWLPDFVPPDRREPPLADWIVRSGGALYAGARAYGVARYAGAKWVRHNIDEGELSGVLRATESAAGDGDGGVWVGFRGGVCRHRGDAWTCMREGFAQKSVVALATGPQKELWAAVAGGGLRRYDGSAWSEFGPSDGLPSRDVRAVQVAKDGAVFALVSPAPGRMYVVRLAVGAQRFLRVAAPEEPTAMALDRDGQPWLGTTSGALLRWNGSAFVHEPKFGPLRGTTIRRLAFDLAGHPWVLQDRERGVRFYDGKSWASFTRRTGLMSNRARDIAIDAQGVVWIATDEGVTEYARAATP
jgi:ligand-binding sensor domain-containing protein